MIDYGASDSGAYDARANGSGVINSGVNHSGTKGARVNGLVCFYAGGDVLNRRLLDRLNGSGRLYLTHTSLAGRFTLRLCVGQTNTEARHVEEGWRRIREAAKEPEKAQHCPE